MIYNILKTKLLNKTDNYVKNKLNPMWFGFNSIEQLNVKTKSELVSQKYYYLGWFH